MRTFPGGNFSVHHQLQFVAIVHIYNVYHWKERYLNRISVKFYGYKNHQEIMVKEVFKV